MTVVLSVEPPKLAQQLSDLQAELKLLRRRVRSAENNAANLERALATNRRIGIAIGILICRHQLTAEQAFAILRTCSQRRNVKVRELAETLIYTGTL